MTVAGNIDSATTCPNGAVAQLCETYDGNAYRLLRDVADHLELSLAYVDRATVEAHFERAVTPAEWQSMRCQFRAMDFDEHVGDQGDVRTRWIDTILERAGVTASDATTPERR